MCRWGHYILPYILEIFAMPPWLAEGEVDIMIQICKAYPNGCDKATALKLLGEDHDDHHDHGHGHAENVGHNVTEEGDEDEATDDHPRGQKRPIKGHRKHDHDLESRLGGLEAGVKAIDGRVGVLEKLKRASGANGEIQAEVAAAGSREVASLNVTKI